jgi:hypothetical protein
MSLCGVGGLRIVTPLQRRRTFPQKKGTTGIYPCVSGLHSSVIFSFICILLVTYLLARLTLVGNSFSCTSSEFTLSQAIKFKKKLT